MKTWTLVWFLVFPPNDIGETQWEYHKQTDMTYQQCVAALAEKELEIHHKMLDDDIIGSEIYCKDQRGTPVPIQVR